MVVCGATQVRALRQSTYIQCMLNRAASDSLKEALEALVAVSKTCTHSSMF